MQLTPTGEALKGHAPFAVGSGKNEQARFSLGQKQDHKGHKH